MSNKNHSQRIRYGWLVFALAVIGLSFAGWHAGAISFRLPKAPQLFSAPKLSKAPDIAADAIPAIPPLFFEALTPSLPSLMLQPAGCGASFAQAPGSPVSVGDDPEFIAVGDFNLDGKPDFAVANSSLFRVTIWLGNGNGSFAQSAGSPINVPDFPYSIAVGDFNLDGKQDLAVTSLLLNSVSILLGNGLGNFAHASGSPISTGDSPQSVAVGDFNLDGKPDLVTANALSDNVTVLVGDGNGSFTQAVGSPVSVVDGPISVTVADFNLDGKLDLATANALSDDVTILLGSGNGSFSPTAGSPPNVGDRPFSVAVGDFNLDGKPDLSVANLNSNNVAILLGTGNGIFGAAMFFATGTSPHSVTVVDFSLDGKPDLAVANLGSNNTTILLGVGNGSFTQPADSPITAGTGPISLAAEDFNRDGKLDLVVANANSANVTVLLNTCPTQPCSGIAFSQPAGSPVSAGDGTQYLAVGDFNLDGKPDYAVSNFFSRDVDILLGNGNGSFVQAVGSPVSMGSSPGSMAVADFNLDGKSDLVVAITYSNYLKILLGNGNGSFTQAAGSPVSVGSAPSSVIAGDFNLDGKIDIAVTNSTSNNLTILLGNGMAGFMQPAGSPFATGRYPESAVTKDFNLDGKPDLAVANGIGNVTILLGNGTGSFAQATGSPVIANYFPYSIVTEDLNLDGKPDLAVANRYSNDVTILLGNGNGNFTQPIGSPVNVGVSTNPISLATGDFNLDGKPDLAISNESSNDVVILLGNGSGGLTQQFSPPIGAGSTPNSLTAVDFNLDGKLDLAVANFNSDNVTILINTCIPPNTPPTIACPANITVNNTSDQCSAVVTFTSNATGIPMPTVVCSPTSGSAFPVGTTTVICTASNGILPNATCSFTVMVNDTQSPSITCPANVFLGTTGNSVIASWNPPSVSDNCSGIGSPVCSPLSGSSFNVGVTTVTCTVKDAANNSASCGFTVTVNRVSGSANDPLACTGPGSKVQATLNISNDWQVNQNVISNTTFTNLIGVPGSCSVMPNVGACTVTAAGVNYTATLTPGTTVTITYLTQVSDLASPGAQVCTNNSVSFNGGQPLTFSACDVIDCPAAGPGGTFPATAEASDQKAGSVLIYNIYTSSTDPNRQNTRINITNIHLRLPAFVHLFFVAEGCSVADSYVCLTANQTASFLASDLDPGTTGYLVAVAVDALGCPTNFNNLIGDEYVKFASGHAANLSAHAFAALPGGLPLCDGNSVTAQLNFDGVSYNRLPAVLALSNVGSRADGNDTLLILNRIGGNLGIGASTLGSIFGIFYDDAENSLSFSVSGNCQLRNSLSNNFPRIAPRFETFIPAGRTGWLKLFSQSDIGITGSAINFNANAVSSAGAFNQGHNLNVLTLSSTNSYVVPVFPPSC